VNSTALNGAWRTQGASTNTGRATSRLLSTTAGHAFEACEDKGWGCQLTGADRTAGMEGQGGAPAPAAAPAIAGAALAGIALGVTPITRLVKKVVQP